MRIARPLAAPRDEIWASTDDGLVHVTRDDGKSWQNVTPAGMPELTYVGCVEISRRRRHDLSGGNTLQACRLQAIPVPQHGWWANFRVDQWRFSRRRDHPRGTRRSSAQGAVVRRHRDGRLLQPERWTKLDAHGRGPAGRADLRSEDQGHGPGGGNPRPLVLDPGRHDAAQRPRRRQSRVSPLSAPHDGSYEAALGGLAGP